MKKTLLAMLLLMGMASGRTRTLAYPENEQVLWGSHNRTEFAIIVTVPSVDMGPTELICASEWTGTKFNLNQLKCHDAIPVPTPKGLRK
jgi:hypothetical protein